MADRWRHSFCPCMHVCVCLSFFCGFFFGSYISLGSLVFFFYFSFPNREHIEWHSLNHLWGAQINTSQKWIANTFQWKTTTEQWIIFQSVIMNVLRHGLTWDVSSFCEQIWAHLNFRRALRHTHILCACFIHHTECSCNLVIDAPATLSISKQSQPISY